MLAISVITMDAPVSEYVTLVSNDEFEFIVSRKTAYVSGTIRRMLDPNSTIFCPAKPLAVLTWS